MKYYKINLPSKFKLNDEEIITLDPEDIANVTFLLHVPDVRRIYNHLISKGFESLEFNEEWYLLSKPIKLWIMKVRMYKDGFIEGFIGREDKMINVIYDLYDNYRDAYEGLHIYYKPRFGKGGWIIDIIEYFRIELPKPDITPWEPKIFRLSSPFSFLKFKR